MFDSNLTVSSSTISGNSAPHGGGIYTEGSAASVSVIAPNNVIMNNTASGFGGGIFVGRFVDMTINAAQITGNTAGTTGGGIYIAGLGPLLSNVLFEQNQPDNCNGTFCRQP